MPVPPACAGQEIQLSAIVTGVYGTESYTFEQFAYLPETYEGGTPVIMGDDEVYPAGSISPGIDIGFPFCFLNNSVDHFWIGSNGWISFLPGQSTAYAAGSIPNINAPQKAIFAPWQDWDPSKGAHPSSGYIFYKNEGASPDRKLIVYWKNCPLYDCNDSTGSFQIVLHETSNIIDNHITLKSTCPSWPQPASEGNKATQGIQSIPDPITGNIPYYIAFDRNQTSWHVWPGEEESTHFIPSGISWHEGSPTGTVIGYGDKIFITATVSTTYYAVLAACDNTGNYVASVDVIVYPLPVPTFVSGDITACQNDIKTYTTESNQNHYTWVITGGVPVAGGGGGANDPWIDVQWTSAGANTITVSYTSPDGCLPLTPTNLDVTVNAFESPVITTSADEFCPENEVTFTCQAGKTNYQWDYAASGATWISGGSATENNVVLKWSSPGPKTVYVNYTDAGCTGDPPVAKQITIKPTPVITGVLTKEICSGDNTGITLSASPPGTVLGWITPPPLCSANISPPCPTGVAAGTQISDIISLTNATQGTVTYYISPILDGCPGITQEYLVTINPLPSATINGDVSVCQNAQAPLVTFTGTDGFPPYTFTYHINTGPDQTVTTIAGNSVSVPASTSNAGVFTYTLTSVQDGSLTACSQPQTGSATVVVHPYPDVTFASATPSICSGGQLNISLASLVPNTTYSWSASGYSANITPGPSVSGTSNPIIQSFSNAGHTVESITFEVTASAAGCSSSPVDYSISVNPVPAVDLVSPAEQSACSGTPALPVILGTDVIGATVDYSWTASCDPGIPACPPGGSGTTPAVIPPATMTNTTFLQQNVTYSITAHLGVCTGPPSAYIVKVTPVADVVLPVSPPNPQVICSGQPTLDVPLSSQVTTLTVDYSWTTNCEPGIPVCPLDGNGDHIPPTAISNTALTSKNATYTITPAVNGCPGIPATYLVQVNPSPTVNTTPMEQEICSGNPSSLVVLTANVTPTTFAWEATPSSGAITGFLAGPNTGDIPSQTLNNTSGVQGYVNYHIIPSSQSGMPCPGAPADYKIYVNPLPAPVISGPQQVCYDHTATVYDSPFYAAHDYLWTVTGAVSFTGNHTNSITVDWGPGPSGTIQLTDVDQSHPTNCSQTTPVYTVIINPAPTPVISSLPPVPDSPCGFSTVTYTLGAPQANHAYQWTVVGGNPVNGTNSSISVTWGNANPVSVTVIESTSFTPGVVCSATDTKLITLNLIPDPAGLITGPSSVCQSPALQNTYFVSPVSNADSYTWTYSQPAGVSITNNGTTATLSFSPGSLGGNLVVQGNKTGCGPGPLSPAFPITVHALPLVTLSACFDPVTSISAKPFLLKGGVPLGPGGVYSIDGIPAAGNWLTPSAMSTGLHTISFSYTDANTCEASDSKTITVLGANPPCGITMTDHRDSPPSIYKTAFLGGKCWMTENLHYGSKIITPTPTQPQPQTDNCISEKYCLVADNENCSNYGGLYQWDEIIQYGQTQAPYQGLCPPGWHLPSAAEWQDLIDANQGNGIAGGNLQYTGFNALTMGLFYLNTLWAFTAAEDLKATMFWTSTVSDTNPIARGVNNISPSVSMYESSRANAFQVRCVKD